MISLAEKEPYIVYGSANIKVSSVLIGKSSSSCLRGTQRKKDLGRRNNAYHTSILQLTGKSLLERDTITTMREGFT